MDGLWNGVEHWITYLLESPFKTEFSMGSLSQRYCRSLWQFGGHAFEDAAIGEFRYWWGSLRDSLNTRKTSWNTEHSPFNAMTLALSVAISTVDAAIQTLGVAISSAGHGVSGDISDCRVGITPLMCHYGRNTHFRQIHFGVIIFFF